MHPARQAFRPGVNLTPPTLGLFGTAIGAGVLFFPIRAGFGGLIPIPVMLVLAYPIAFIAIGRWPGYACRG